MGQVLGEDAPPPSVTPVTPVMDDDPQNCDGRTEATLAVAGYPPSSTMLVLSRAGAEPGKILLSTERQGR